MITVIVNILQDIVNLILWFEWSRWWWTHFKTLWTLSNDLNDHSDGEHTSRHCELYLMVWIITLMINFILWFEWSQWWWIYFKTLWTLSYDLDDHSDGEHTSKDCELYLMIWMITLMVNILQDIVNFILWFEWSHRLWIYFKTLWTSSYDLNDHSDGEHTSIHCEPYLMIWMIRLKDSNHKF